MAIGWTLPEAAEVGAVLAKYHVDTGECLAAARTIHPMAIARDAGSTVWQLWPAEGRYVVPRAKLKRPWYYHATVEVEAHCVDALTGVPGTHRDDYATAHWKFDALKWIIDDLEEAL